MMPSTSRLLSGPSAIRAPSACPSHIVAVSIPCMSGAAHAYTAWKIRNITTASVNKPTTGCSSQRSSASSTRAVRVGMRTASAIAIGTATIAAFIGAGGLGERIVTGLALNDSALMLAGALPAAGLALLSELLFETLDRYLRRKRERR